MRGHTTRSRGAAGRPSPFAGPSAGPLAAISALSLFLAGCASSGSGALPAAPVAPAALPMSITSNPANGSADVLTTFAPVVSAAGGRLSRVVLRSADGRTVPGRLAPAGTTWRATGALVAGATYTVEVVGLDAGGRQITHRSSFSTQKPKKIVKAFVTPLAGRTVGIGQPIVVTFSKAVKDRAAVESRLLVETSKPLVGAWHWMSDKRVHFRPIEYWPDHTKVTLRTNLKDVHIGRDIWGDENREVSFEIGRSQVSIVDVDKLTMTVFRDGEKVKTFPVSTGKPGFRTRGGKKVVLATERSKTMDATSIGISPGSSEYYRLFVEYAVRITWSGEFVHAAPWSVRYQGRQNVSHGCVGMSMANAKWFYDHTILGDVVDVQGSKRKMELENGYGDWNLSWEDWLKGSALPQEAPAATATAAAEPAAGLAAAQATVGTAETATTPADAAADTSVTPAAPKPAAVKPAAPNPAAVKPAAARPTAARPTAARPAAARPAAAKPAAAKPAGKKPAVNRAGSKSAAAEKPAARPAAEEAVRPEPAAAEADAADRPADAATEPAADDAPDLFGPGTEPSQPPDPPATSPTRRS